MNILLAAIIFTFFAVFAPTSHGDRPLLHADHSNGEVAYLDFKIPIARLQAATTIEKAFTPVLVSHFFTTFELLTFKPYLFLPTVFSKNIKILIIDSTPFVFCEILQV